MIEKTTLSSDLLQYYYNETGLQDSDRIQRIIDGDPLIAGDYSALVEVLDSLNLEHLEPSENCLKQILLAAA